MARYRRLLAILVLLPLLLLGQDKALADATAATSAGTGADNSGVGTQAWSNPTRVVASDNSRATATNASAFVTHYLVGSQFGFSIPSGATINGILAEIEKSNNLAGTFECQDSKVRIVKADASIGTTDKAAGGNWPNNAGEAYTSYGSSSDLWGETWTDTDINDTDFGVAISATCTGGANARVDHIRITVTYTPAAAVAAGPTDVKVMWFF